MKPSFLFKLSGLLLVAWVTLGTPQLNAQLFVILCGLLVLVACLDAGQAFQGSADSKEADVGMDRFFRQFVSISGAPFYVALMVFAFVGMSSQGAPGLAAKHSASACGGAGGCGSGAGGCGSGGCGSKSGGCGSGGCGSGKKVANANSAGAPKAAPAKLTEAELRQRVEMVQKRSLTTSAAVTPSLPGIGTNAKPLPPGFVPRSGVALPPGVTLPAAPLAQVPANSPQTAANNAFGTAAATPAAPAIPGAEILTTPEPKDPRR